MKVKDIIDLLENTLGRQSEGYMFNLIDEALKDISSKDPRVIGITHSRNFGSQAAFLSGLEMANKEGCVLLDGDLQDPPELIPSFMEEWRKGAEVVYGRRTKREMIFDGFDMLSP